MTTNESRNELDSSEALRDMEEIMDYEKDEELDNNAGNSIRSTKRRLGVTAEKSSFNLSYHPNRVTLYSPPRQRQRWGDSQVLPRTNWGDLFFDLFYVAATYNVSYILVDNPNGEGLLYAAGTFLPVMGIWLTKVVYDSRFVYEDDIFHRLFEVGALVVVACAVLYIRPVKYLSNPAEHNTMFLFGLILVVERIVVMIFYAEVYFFAVGQREVLKKVARSQFVAILVPTVFYVAAMIVAGLEYYGDDDEGSEKRILAAEDAASSYAADYGEKKSHTHIPIWLILAGYLSSLLYMTVNVICFFPGGGRHKEFAIPMNIEFTMHRNGEWTILMLGESIFSLLIVDVPDENNDYYATFYCGILAVVLLMCLHFRSQPTNPDHHASRRDKNAGMLCLWFQHIYSLALVSLGAAFTFFLTSFGNDYTHRRLLVGRELAGDNSGVVSSDIEANAAHLFCGSLAVIFLSLDAMILLHIGIKESQQRCVCANTSKKNSKGVVLLAFRSALLIFTATLSQWEQDPETLSLVGLMLLLTQLILRKLGAKYLSHGQMHALGQSDSSHGHNSAQSTSTAEKIRCLQVEICLLLYSYCEIAGPG